MKKISGKLIAAIIACVILMGTAIFGILFWDDESINSIPTVFAIDKLASEEVKLSEKSITLTTSCDSNDVDIEWSCSNMNKATIEDGVLSLREEGIVVVSAEVVGTDLRDEVVVSIINDIPTTATGIEILNKPEETLGYEDDTFYVSYRLIPESAKEEEVIYKSSNPKAVKIDEEGKVTVLAPGEANVRVALKSNPDIFDECTLDFAWDRYIGDDGTFEGKKGTVSLYSPTVEDEIKHASYNTYNPIVFKQAVNKDGTSALAITSSTTGWDSLFIKFDQKVKKGEIYNISFESEWLGEKEPTNYGHAILTGTDKWITGDDTNLMNYHRDVKWFDGNVSIPFTANADADCAYLVLIVQDSEINLDMLVDNIQMSSASAVILDRAVYNDDGTFEGKKGNISLLSAHLMGLGVEGYGWSNQISLEKIKNESGNAVKVTSKGTHSIDYLYIKVDMPVKQGYKYTVKMDLEGLDEASKKGTYGYWVLSPEANLKKYIQYYSPVSSKDFLKKDAAFTFVSNGDYDSFYLLLREYTVEGEDVKFNFSIDNVRINEDGYIGQETWLNDDGTFEGTKGNISLYSPTVTSEIAKKDYHVYNSVLFKQIEKEDKTHVLSVESIGTKWDTIFLKFNQQLKRGTTYTIAYDAEWKGGKQPETYNSYGYAVMPNTENWITGNESNLVNYKNDVKWFDGKVEIVFTANADVDVWYLVLVDQNKDIPIQMTIDNVKVSAEKYPVMNSVLNDDGTFEGIPGNFSFYSISELDKTKLNVNCAFQNNVSTFQKVDTDNGTAMAVKTTGTRASMVYVKIKEALVAGNEYEFSYNAKWLGDSLEGINYGYAILPTIANWVTTSNANLEDNILNYTKTPNAFDGDFSITFKPAKNYEECYFVLFIQSKEVLVDMLIDNVTLVKKQASEPVQDSITNDDGTFEGKDGIVSLYSPKTSGTTNSNATYCTDVVSFQKVDTGENTVLSIKSEDYPGHATRKGAVYIKFARTFKQGKTYTISYDAQWNGADLDSNATKFGYAILPSVNNWLNTDDNIQKYQKTTAVYDGEVSIEFTPTADCNEIYLLLYIDDLAVYFDMTIDNIKVKTDYSAETSILNDDGTFEGKDGIVSLHSPQTVGTTNTNATYCTDVVSFQKIDTSDSTVLAIKSEDYPGHSTRKGAVYIKFARTFKQGQTYTLSYDAKWNGADLESNSGKFGYSILPSANNWLNTDDNIKKYQKTTTVYDGKVSIEFTPAADCNECYLLLYIDDLGIYFDMTIDNIKVTTEYSVETSVLNVNGNFEGKDGIVSLYSPKTSGTTNTNATFCTDVVSFQKVDTGANTVLSIKSEDYPGHATRKGAVYIKFARTFKQGKTYTISYDAKWNGADLESNSGKFGYSILPSVNNWLTTAGNIKTFTKTTAVYDGKVSIEFTPTADCNECYLLLYIDDLGIYFDMTIDNIKVTTEYSVETSVLNVNGNFEGDNGIVSLYYPATSGTTNADAKFCTDVVSFQKIDTGANTVLSIKSGDYPGHATRKGAVYIKFAQEFKKDTTYIISYDAEWNGASLETYATKFGYSLLPSVNNWLNTNDNIKKYQKTTAVYDGKVSIEFTPIADCSECYLLLFIDDLTVYFDMTVDNIKVQTK